MATLLLIVIFSAYIGLGVPDSLFGSAWPAICEELGVAESLAWTVSTPIVGFTLMSSMLSSFVIEKFGTKMVTFVSTALTAIALILTSYCNSVWAIVLCGVPLGFGAGAVDTALNSYVAIHYKASHMSFLHCFYGVGIAISPYLMSLALKTTSWRVGYRFASLLQFAITFITLISFPLWKVHPETEKVSSEQTVCIGKFKDVLKNPLIIPIFIIFVFSCSIEAISGTWATTYLVSIKGASKSDGALFLSVYCAGLAIGRFLSGILAIKIKPKKIITLGLFVLLFAVILLLVPTKNLVLSVISLFFIGLGNGPVYPNFTHLTPLNFGIKNAPRAMSLQMTAAYLGVLCSPPTIGLLSKNFSLKVFPIAILICFTFLVVAFILYNLKSKEIKNG